MASLLSMDLIYVGGNLWHPKIYWSYVPTLNPYSLCGPKDLEAPGHFASNAPLGSSFERYS